MGVNSVKLNQNWFPFCLVWYGEKKLMEDCYRVGLETIKLLIGSIFGVNQAADWAAPHISMLLPTNHNWFKHFKPSPLLEIFSSWHVYQSRRNWVFKVHLARRWLTQISFEPLHPLWLAGKTSRAALVMIALIWEEVELMKMMARMC